MNRKRFTEERSLTFHLIGNRNYDNHLKKLKDIYDKPKASSNLRRLVTAPQGLDLNKRNRDYSFKYGHMTRQRQITEDNMKMVKQLRAITQRKDVAKHSSESSKMENYLDINFQGRILEKKRMLERLNQENQRLTNKLKTKQGNISIQALESQFKKNRQVADNISRYKRDSTTNQTTINGCLVYENGRYRRSGSSYLSIATPRSSRSARSIKAPSIKLSTSKINTKGKAGMTGLNDSRRSSRASLRSKADSHRSLSNRHPIQQFRMPAVKKPLNLTSGNNLSRDSHRKVDSQRSISRHSAKLTNSFTASAARPKPTFTSQRNQRLLNRLAKYN